MLLKLKKNFLINLKRRISMSDLSNEFTTPPGRIVQGSLYEPITVDINGNKLIFKTGKNKGEERVSYYFALAIPKNNEKHWTETEWGKKIWFFVHNHYQNKTPRDFTWKVDDGDSTVPNSNDVKNCDREGFPGNWILRLSNGFPSPIWDFDLEKRILEEDFVNPGDWVEVNVLMAINDKPNSKQSVFLNHRVIRFNSYGERIQFTNKDPKSCGFTGSMIGSQSPMPTTNAQHAEFNANISNPQTPPLPYPEILDPKNSSIPMPPIVPPPPIIPNNKKEMTAKANFTYEQYIQNGWTDELLIQNGLVLP
jgi:hypothetical protein